jgi:hypothetical protein
LADADDEGVSDIYKAHWGSTNILFEIIQRIGCLTHRWGAETEVERLDVEALVAKTLKSFSDSRVQKTKV